MNSAPVRVLLSFLFSLSLLSACGKKAPPKPPEATAPRAVKFLVAEGSTDAVLLRWQAPDENASGDPLDDLVSFSVKRSPYERGEQPDFDELAELQFKTQKEEAAKPVKPKSKEFVYRDASVKAGSSYEYVVVPVNEDGVEGVVEVILRVSFIGSASVIETFQASERSQKQ